MKMRLSGNGAALRRRSARGGGYGWVYQVTARCGAGVPPEVRETEMRVGQKTPRDGAGVPPEVRRVREMHVGQKTAWHGVGVPPEVRWPGQTRPTEPVFAAGEDF